jgi:hypothetical protein
MTETFMHRLLRLQSEITLGMECTLVLGWDPDTEPTEDSRYYFQIRCWRKDAITGVYDFGYSGPSYVNPKSSDSQIVAQVFGLYKGYWEHETRETFQWKGRRIFGPHISLEALWEVARRVDIPSAQHVGELPERPAQREASDDLMGGWHDNRKGANQ